MKFITRFLFLVIVFHANYSEEIRQLYFDPKTSLSSSKQDGIIIIETKSGVKSTICIDFDNASKTAEVICRMMGYVGKPDQINALAMISTRQSVFGGNETHFQGIRCSGHEASLSDCPGFKYHDRVEFRCRDHNQDLHALCLGEFRFDNSTIDSTSSDCSESGLRIASLSNKSHGLLKIRDGNKEFTVCGINRNFGANEARLFCKELLCESTTYARIIEGYHVPNSPIGGFKNMKCPFNATSLADCDNVFPYDNERCTPYDNIGVICSSNPDIPDAYPVVQCSETSLSLFWDKNTFTDIKPEYVHILENGNQCPQIVKDDSVRLSVKYKNCGMVKDGDNQTIIYTFHAKRVYPKINDKIIIKEDQLFKVSCIIDRFDDTKNVTFTISSTENVPVIGDNTLIPTEMVVSVNNKFEPYLLNIKDVDIGSEVFVKVRLVQPPSQLVPFLHNCFIESGPFSEPLITDKCPARKSVVISPLDNVTIMFSFRTFAIGNTADPAFIKCYTSLCGRSSPGCIPTCQEIA